MKYILFSDIFNYKVNNFPELFTFFDTYKVNFKFDNSSADDLKIHWGNIDHPAYNFIYEKYSYCNLYNYKAFNLKDIIQNELLFTISNQEDFRLHFTNTIDIWEFIESNYPNILKKYLQIGRFWIDYWLEKINANQILAGITFGGSTIFSASFTHVLRYLGIPCYILEHFFTGKDFYFELRYKSLPNSAYFISNSYSLEHWMEKINRKSNKNVQEKPYQSFYHKDYILIIGQVYNDFSIISEKNKYKNSILFYKELINTLLNESNELIVFKAHPYEYKKIKNNIKSTLEELEYFKLTLPPDKQKRIVTICDYNMQALFNNCKFSITLTSQAGLESIYQGKPLVTFNGAFYSKKGFTYDFDEIGELINFIKTNNIIITTNQLVSYNEYMKKVFNSLVGKNEFHKIEYILRNILLDVKKSEEIKSNNTREEIKSNNTREEIKSNNTREEIKKYNKSQYIRLFNKLKKNPKQFFLDSQFKIIRPLGKFFK